MSWSSPSRLIPDRPEPSVAIVGPQDDCPVGSGWEWRIGRAGGRALSYGAHCAFSSGPAGHSRSACASGKRISEESRKQVGYQSSPSCEVASSGACTQISHSSGPHRATTQPGSHGHPARSGVVLARWSAGSGPPPRSPPDARICPGTLSRRSFRRYVRRIEQERRAAEHPASSSASPGYRGFVWGANFRRWAGAGTACRAWGPCQSFCGQPVRAGPAPARTAGFADASSSYGAQCDLGPVRIGHLGPGWVCEHGPASGRRPAVHGPVSTEIGRPHAGAAASATRAELGDKVSRSSGPQWSGRTGRRCKLIRGSRRCEPSPARPAGGTATQGRHRSHAGDHSRPGRRRRRTAGAWRTPHPRCPVGPGRSRSF